MTQYQSKNFQLNIANGKDEVRLRQQVFKAVNTKELPQTISVLKKSIPSIFQNLCFNKKNLSFRKEVESTEIGHLLEHLILENMKILAFKKVGKAKFRGETVWNWNNNPYGQFDIIIKGKGINLFFNTALATSIRTLESIYDS